MVRWEPGTRGRLRTAALDLYADQGFEQTTVADIAAAAGVTERTFFRHFTDKREVLFHGQDELQRVVLEGLAAAPDDAPPMQMVTAALRATASFFDEERRPWSRRRQAVIDANAPLREREALKLRALAAALAAALGARGVPEPTASLSAETGVTAFGVGFGMWVAPGETRSFWEVELDVLAELGALTAAVARS